MDCDNCQFGYFCCTLNVRLSFWDYLRIMLKGYKKKDFVDYDFSERKCIKLVNGDCYFLVREGDKAYCGIYPARPRICRIFPFFYPETRGCADIVKKWKRKVVKETEFGEGVLKT